MKSHLVLLCTVAFLTHILRGAPPASPAPAPRAVEGRLSVRAFGATGDGKTDDAPAFQRALDAAGKTLGSVVQIPVGNFVLKSQIRVPPWTTLEGVWRGPTAGSEMKGSTLLPMYGAGDEKAPPLILVETSATLKGVTVFYHEQNDPDNIKPFPWCITGKGDNITISDCLLVNPYRGIDLGSQRCGRHLVQRVYGQPLKLGIFVDQCFDVGRIENIHFWPFWKWQPKSKIADWMLENSEAFVFGRTDWQYVLNTFCFGYKVGYKFIGSKEGGCNGNFVGIAADASRRAIVVEAIQAYGLLITNGEFVSMGPPDATHVEVRKNVGGTIQFANCSFWGPARNNAILDGGITMFSNCHFQEWDGFKQKAPSIVAQGGRLIVNGCRFSHGPSHITLGPKVGSAVIMGNLMGSPISIQNEIGDRAQIGLNVGDTPIPKNPRPAGSPDASKPGGTSN